MTPDSADHAKSDLAKTVHAALRSGRSGMNAAQQYAESNKWLGAPRWGRPYAEAFEHEEAERAKGFDG